MSNVISMPTRTVNSMTSILGVDTMMLDAETARTTPWADLATVVDEAPCSSAAIQLAGLDWTVEQSRMAYEANGVMRYTNKLVNHRSDTGEFLGVVSGNYKPINNADAFAFTDLLVDGGEARYSSAGSLRGGQMTFVSLDLGKTNILGDEHDRFVVVANDHTGKHALRATFTMIRCVCLNTLNMLLKRAKRIISIPHIGNLQMNMLAAKDALLGMNAYSEALNDEMERLAKVKVSKADVERLLNELFPIPEDGVGKQRLNGLVYMRGLFDQAMKADDLANLAGTGAWLVNAASDVAYHRRSLRTNAKHGEGIMSQLFTGASILDQTYNFVNELAA